jgi:hypothetical protein
MKNGITVISLSDNFGRRSGIDRRRKVNPDLKMEKRISKDRRSRIVRRRGLDRRGGIERRGEADFKKAKFLPLNKDHIPVLDEKGHTVAFVGPGRRTGRDRRSGVDRRDFLIL